MNRGLLYLLRAESVGTFRVLRRRLRGVKGVVVGSGFALFFTAILGQHILETLTRDTDEEALRQTADSFRLWGPPALLFGLLIFGVSMRSLYFKPAEIDFLFPAPVSRRQLVAFNVLSRMRVQTLSTLWCWVFFLSWSGSWYGALVGAFLLFTLVQLTTQASGLLFSTLSETLGKRLRIVAWIVVGALAGGAVLAMVASTPELGEITDLIRHPVIRGVSIVTRPFVEVFLSRSPATLLLWGSISAALLVAEFLLILLTDVAFSERSLAAGRKVQARLRRMRSDGSAMAASSPGSARWSLPGLPRLGGAGVLAWRQGLEILRNLRSILTMLLLGLIPVVPLWMVRRRFNVTDDQGLPPGEALGGNSAISIETAVPLVVLMTIMFTQNTAFDFRRDLDRMVTFKTLPLRSSIIAAGQILPMTGLLTAVQYLVIAVLVPLCGEISVTLLVTTLIGLPLLNWNVIALDNAVFLFFPYRINPQDTSNVPFMGRVMLTMFFKMTALGVLVGIGAVLGTITWMASESVLVTGAVAAIYLLTVTYPATLLVALAFRRFDVSRDV